MIGYIIIGIAVGGIIGYLLAESKSKILTGKHSALIGQLQQKENEISLTNNKLLEANAELRELSSKLAETEMARKKDLEKIGDQLTLLASAKEQ